MLSADKAEVPLMSVNAKLLMLWEVESKKQELWWVVTPCKVRLGLCVLDLNTEAMRQR